MSFMPCRIRIDVWHCRTLTETMGNTQETNKPPTAAWRISPPTAEDVKCWDASCMPWLPLPVHHRPHGLQWPSWCRDLYIPAHSIRPTSLNKGLRPSLRAMTPPSPDPLGVLRKHWGFSSFRNCQQVRGSTGRSRSKHSVALPALSRPSRAQPALQEVIEAVLQGADTLVVMVRGRGVHLQWTPAAKGSKQSLE